MDDVIPYVHVMERVAEYVWMLETENPTITQKITLIGKIHKEVGLDIVKDANTDIVESENSTMWDNIEVRPKKRIPLAY